MEEKSKFIDLKKFQLQGRIGKGAFSKVFKVKNIDTDEIYAAKILKYKVNKNSVNEQEILSLFNEVNLMSSLNHPSILEFIGFSPTNFHNKSFPTIVTKYASNGSLRDILKLESQGLSPKDWDDTRKLITIFGIASGLLYLHSNNIMHRDMKPENVLMDDYLFPKIGDFGFSKITISISKSMNLQSKNHFKGTPIYMAPEVLADKEYSFPVDVYSFSMIVYEIMTGEVPFKGLEYPQLLLKVIQGERPALHNSIPAAYQDLIEKCWKQDPYQRPKFKEIVEQLKKNANFITEAMDSDEYYNYVEMIEDYKSSFDTSRRFHFEEFTKHKGRRTTIKHVDIEKVIQKKVVEDNDDDLENSEKIVEEKVDDSKSIEKVDDSKNIEKVVSKINKDEINKDLIIKLKYDDLVPFERREPIRLDSVDSKNKSRKHSLFKSSDKYSFFFEYPMSEYYNLDEKCQKLIDEASTDPEMQFLVGSYSIEGRENFPQNIQVGLSYLEKSVESNCIDSLIYYCRLLIKGRIISRDLCKAKKLLKKGLKYNDQRIFLIQGKLCQIEGDYSNAKKIIEKSAKMGNNESMFVYAKMLLSGQYCKKNEQEAIKYLELSKQNGFNKSSVFLANYEKINNYPEIKKLPDPTQVFLISQISKSKESDIDGNHEFHEINIKFNKLEMLYSNNSLNSQYFIQFLNKFTNISIEVQIPSQSIESVEKIKLEFDMNKQSKVTLHAIASQSLKSIKKEYFLHLHSLTKIVIPISIKEINDLSFDGLSLLEEVSFVKPSSLTKIGSYSFHECSSLAQIIIPSSVIIIDKCAFKGCSSLKDVLFEDPSSLTRICEYAFDGCYSLTFVSIPSSIDVIEAHAFRGCLSMKTIKIPFLYNAYDTSHSVYNRKNNDIKPGEFKKCDCKIISLGALNSGNSNLFRLYNIIMDKGERCKFIEIIRTNILSDIKKLVEQYQSEGLTPKDDNLNLAIKSINKLFVKSKNLTPEIAEKINLIWDDQDIKNIYNKTMIINNFMKNNSAYFFDRVEKIASKFYKPSDEDIVNTRIQSEISKSQFIINNKTKVHWFNVEGHKIVKEKYKKEFSNVNAFIFVVSLTEFTETDFDDNNKTMFHTSLELFKSTVLSPAFINIPVIFIFCKRRSFDKLLEQNPRKFKKVFPDFTGDVNNTSQCFGHYISAYTNLIGNERKKITITTDNIDRIHDTDDLCRRITELISLDFNFELILNR